MEIPESQLNRPLFDARTGGKWSREPLESFACLGCGRLYIGVPYAHDLLLDADQPTERMAYNRPEGAQCPTCGTVLQGAGQRTRDPLPGEIQASAWGWILCE